MTGFPKPPRREKRPRKPIKRGKAIERGKVIPRSRKKIVSKYAHPKYRALVAKVRRRSKGMCEEPDCTMPAEQVHHLVYSKGAHVKSLLVPLDQLIHLCFQHHQERHDHKLRR